MTMLGIALSIVTLWGGAAPPQEVEPAPQAPSQEAVNRLDELEIEIEDFVSAWREEQRAIQKKYAEEAKQAEAEGREVSRPMMSMRPDFAPFLKRLNEWADASGGEDQALYLTQIVSLDGVGKDSAGRAAFDRLTQDHIASPSWARLGRLLRSLDRMLEEEECADLLARLAESPSGDVRGWIAIVRHSDTIDTAERDSEAYRDAKAALLKAAEEASDTDLRDQLSGAIELREKLGVGATAPDISGIDIDGVAFKLSDYRGKILFVDFWGDW